MIDYRFYDAENDERNNHLDSVIIKSLLWAFLFISFGLSVFKFWAY